MKLDGFLVAMAIAVLVAVVAPQLGAEGGLLPLQSITTAGISLVFFLHGANLDPKNLRSSLRNWRLHLFIQSSTFIAFPIAGVGLLALSIAVPAELKLGVFYLCAVCSTVSSSVALVGMARGNISAAVFNASISGLIGIVVTPFLVGLVHMAGATDFSILNAIAGISMKLLLPFALGQGCRPLIRGFIGKHKRWINIADRAVIILIVFTSFSASTAEGLWTQFSPALFVMLAIVVAAILAAALAMTMLGARALRLNREDKITAIFCGTQKSLAAGVPMAGVLFHDDPALGAIILPLVLYHQFQLIACTVLARRLAAGDSVERN